MMKRFVIFLSNYISLNRRWLFPVIGFPILWRLLFVFTDLSKSLAINFLSDSIDPGFEVAHLIKLLSALLIPLILSNLFLSFGLGLGFKRKGNESWMSRLPVSDITFSFTPYLFLAAFGICLYWIAPKAWDFLSEVSGFPIVFILGIVPLSSFLTVRSIKNSALGLFCSAICALLVLATGELIAQRVHHRNELVLELSYLKSTVELGCLFFALILVGIFEKKKKQITGIVAGSSACVGIAGLVLVFQFQEEKKNLTHVMEPMDKIVSSSYSRKAQCDKPVILAKEIIDRNPDHRLKTREEFSTVIQALKQYPIAIPELKDLFGYFEKTPTGIAEALALEKMVTIYGCDLLFKSKLQKLLIETVSNKPEFLALNDLKSGTSEVWSSLQKSASALGIFLQVLVDVNTLQMLSDKGLIDDRFKLEILELSRDADASLREIRHRTAVFNSFRTLSPERVHVAFESLRKEYQMNESLRNRLHALLERIQKTQPKLLIK